MWLLRTVTLRDLILQKATQHHGWTRGWRLKKKNLKMYCLYKPQNSAENIEWASCLDIAKIPSITQLIWTFYSRSTKGQPVPSKLRTKVCLREHLYIYIHICVNFNTKPNPASWHMRTVVFSLGWMGNVSERVNKPAPNHPQCSFWKHTLNMWEKVFNSCYQSLSPICHMWVSRNV